MHYLYKITNMLNGKVYIGQSNKETERWRQHKYFARRDEPIQYVHRTMKKYGVDNFVYEVIATCQTQEDVDCIEEELINQYDSRNKENGYNIAPGGNHAWNAGLPKEQQPMFGKKQSEHQKQRCSEVHSGKTVIHSEEWRQHMSKIMNGRENTWSDKMVETRIKNGTYGQTEMSKKKISAGHVGKTHTEETKQKMSSAHIGKKKSEETKKRISLARKKYSLEQELQMIKDRNAGLTYKEIGIKYGSSAAVIFNIIKRNKL